MLLQSLVTGLLLAGRGLAQDCRAEITREMIAKLRESLGGDEHVLETTRDKLPGLPCYDPVDENQCNNIYIASIQHSFHTNHPFSVAWNQNAHNTCPALSPLSKAGKAEDCSTRGYPTWVVNATTAEHVQTVLKFVNEHNVALNVKNTGHDYRGRSNTNAPHALSLWTHHINPELEFFDNNLQLNDNKDKVKTTFKGTAVKVGAGAQFGNVYHELKKKNLTIVGGTSKTVGLAGWAMGGGHSILSNKYGLGADNVLEMEVVKPNGDLVRANKHRETRLFFALRGGGGSTFGVVTSMTFKTYPDPKMATVYFALVSENEKEGFDVTGRLMSQLPKLVDKGLNGYLLSIHQDKLSDMLLKEAVDAKEYKGKEFTGITGTLVLVGSDDIEQVKTKMERLKTRLVKQDSGIKLMARYEKHKSLLEFLTEFEPLMPSTAGVNLAMHSKLANRNMLENTRLMTNVNRDIMSKINKFKPLSPKFGVLLIGGKGLANANNVGENAVHGSWRQTYASLFAFQPAMNETDLEGAKTFLINKLKPFSTRQFSYMGMYCNEALPVDDYKKECWGIKLHKRLTKLKESIDEKNVFWCEQCIGSEKMQINVKGLLCKAGYADLLNMKGIQAT